jgi:hypothetical protein
MKCIKSKTLFRPITFRLPNAGSDAEYSPALADLGSSVNYRRFKKNESDCCYNKFSFHLMFVKAIINSDRLPWLKSVNENLRLVPKIFLKMFRKNNRTFNSI